VLKGDRDVTSNIDRDIEAEVRAFLRDRTPGLGFLGEEEGGSLLDAERSWILDPVDGTINLQHGVPLCAISLALVSGGEAEVAAIALPFLGHRYVSVRDGGAYVDGTKIAVSRTSSIEDALVSLDQFSYGAGTDEINALRLRLTQQMVPKVQRLRMLGASAIDLAWTAHGKLDACVLLGNKPWDTAAGVLIAREAGARVLDLDGSEQSISSRATIALVPGLEAEIMAMVTAAINS
jgi:myo-inositol-1(or 4)-monophosphatase